ncbi:MAG: hypothetical protein MRZ79_24135 [Bacteroidia bacterium]|nr:hypothetical protein [Bacteroidia bacterium]
MAFPILVLFGLLIRILYAIYIYPEFLPGDSFFYWTEAEHLANGTGLEFYWPPGLIFWLRPFLAIPFGSVLASLLSWLAFVWAWQSFSKLLPLWKRNLGQLIWATFPAFVHQSVVPLSHLPLALCLLFALIFIDKKISWYVFGAGILFGLMGLFRPASWVLLPFFMLKIFSGYGAWKRFAIFLIGFSMLPICWEIFAFQQLNRVIHVNEANAYNLYLGNHPQTHHYRSWWLGSHDVSEEEEYAEFVRERDSIRNLRLETRDKIFKEKAVGHIMSKPGKFIYRMGSRFRNFWSYDTLCSAFLLKEGKALGYLTLLLDVSIYLILLLGGLFGLGTSGDKNGWLILLYPLPYLLAFAHPTYHLPLLPILCLMALSLKYPVSRKKNRLLLIIFALVLLIQVEWTWDLWRRFF